MHTMCRKQLEKTMIGALHPNCRNGLLALAALTVFAVAALFDAHAQQGDEWFDQVEDAAAAAEPADVDEQPVDVDTLDPVIDDDIGEEAPVAVDIEYEPEELSTDELIRRKELELRAEEQADRAVQAYMEDNFRAAVEHFQSAKELLLNAGRAPRILQAIARTDNAIENVYVDWAEALAKEGRDRAEEEKFDEAIERMQRAIELAPQNEQKYRRRIRDYLRMREEAQFRALITEDVVDPDADARQRQIDILLAQGQVLYERGRYQQALEKFRQARAEDPYQIVAIRMMRRIYEHLRTVGEESRLATEAERLAEVKWKWTEPVSVMGAGPLEPRAPTRRETAGIHAKLENIIFPRIDFEEATIHQVVRFLRERSRDLDPEGEGVNIVLKLDVDTAPAEPVDRREPAFDDAWDLDDDFAFDPAPRPDPAPRRAVRGGITINMTNIPLGEAIRYVTLGAGLVYKVESHAVIIAHPDVALDDMETRFYPMQAGVMETVVTAEAEAVGDGWGIERRDREAPAMADLREFFANFGINFPENSRVAYDPRTSKLVVRNTPANLREVERVLQEINITPTQVTIEAKFVEIKQNDLESLGFEWLITSGDGHFGDGGVLDLGRNFKTQILKQGGDAFPFNTALTGGIRQATHDPTFFSGNDGILALRSVMGSMEFYTVIHALRRSDSSDVLSSPKVTATSGQTAVLRMVTERYFPESWTEPTIDPGTDTVGGSITPSVPEFGPARDIGVVLEATPIVDPDNYTINLQLRPQVNEFLGYDTSLNYDLIIEGQRVEAKAQMPIISSRTVETSVVVWDGETVVLGGMIRENITDYSDRVPFLGDMPLIGSLFRSQGQKKEKFNLLIFVTARLVNPTGAPIRADQEIRGLPDFGR